MTHHNFNNQTTKCVIRVGFFHRANNQIEVPLCEHFHHVHACQMIASYLTKSIKLLLVLVSQKEVDVAIVRLKQNLYIYLTIGSVSICISDNTNNYHNGLVGWAIMQVASVELGFFPMQ